MAHSRAALVYLVSLLACSDHIASVMACVDPPPPPSPPPPPPPSPPPPPPPSPPPPSSAQPVRAVFAHYMLYADVDIGVYKREIQLAQSKGIDAFALNFNVWRPWLVDRMYEAALEVGTGFKIFFSADIHKDSNGNLSPDILVAMLTNYKSHPNQMQYRGKILFTSWLGNDDAWWSEFGTNAINGWNDVFARAGGKDQFFNLHFFPTDGSEWGVKGMLDQWGATIDGLISWDLSAWNPSDVQNKWYMSGCVSRGKTFMASVSPEFFKTQPFGTCQVKLDYQGPGLWLTKWKEIIDNGYPLVEVATWNDWPESSYVGNQFTAQGAALDVTGFPHQAYLELGAYYAQWYKTGNQPAVPGNKMFMFYYTNSKNAGGACTLKEVLTDNLYVTTMLTQPGTLVLTSGSATQSFNAAAGINTYSIASQGGVQQATFNGGTTLVGQQQIKFDVDVAAANFNIYSTFLSF